MKLEKQVISLEYAKRLKELGVKQESLFEWRKYRDGDHDVWVVCNKYADDWTDAWGRSKKCLDKVDAFIVAELGELLPEDYFSGKYFSKGNYHIVDKEGITKAEAKTEANARAKMLIYLLENKLITL